MEKKNNKSINKLFLLKVDKKLNKKEISKYWFIGNSICSGFLFKKIFSIIIKKPKLNNSITPETNIININIINLFFSELSSKFHDLFIKKIIITIILSTDQFCCINFRFLNLS